MAIYTHTFELITEKGINVQGEILFGPTLATTKFANEGEEMSIEEHRQCQKLFESLIEFCKRCGTIRKLEIVEKT